MLSRLLLFFVLFESSPLTAQYALGIGASLHRYDQVLSLHYLKGFRCGGLGVSGGLGVERSLQGALAPQIGLSWQSDLPQKAHGTVVPIYTIAYQVDFQKSSFLDMHQGVYVGLGICFGKSSRYQVQLLGGFVRERLLQTQAPVIPVFLNPQLQFTYYLSARKKWSISEVWNFRIYLICYFIQHYSFLVTNKNPIQQCRYLVMREWGWISEWVLFMTIP